MTAQTVVSGKGFVGFTETAGQGANSVRTGRSGDGKSFDRYMSGKQEVKGSDKADAVKNNRGAVKKFVASDKVTAKNNAFSQDGMESMGKDVNLLNIEFVDGKISVSVVEDAGEAALNPEGLNIDELLSQIKDYLKSQMDITEEEIERAFYECGLNAFSVLQFDNLQQFFVNVNGMEDFSEVLTDGGLMDAWNSFVSDLSELKLMLGDGSTIDASVFSELSEDNDIFEAVSRYLADMSLADKQKAGAEDGQITENVNAADEALQDSAADGNMQMDGSENGNRGLADGGFGTSELNTGVERDNDIKPEAFDENLFQTFIHNIQESVADSDRFDHNQIQQIRDIAFQIIEGVKVNVKADTSSLEIQLNPEALGKVHVAIELKDGIATANFIVRNEMARVAVESQLQTLKDTFEEQGLKVEAVSVTVSDFSFDQRRQAFSEREDGRGGSAGKRRTVIDRMDSVTEEPADDEEIIENEAAGTEHGINITA